MYYHEQKAWKNIMNYLPKEYILTEANLPTEEIFSWHNNKIHLDTYRNKEAKVKVILLHGVGTNGRQMSTIIGKPLADEGYEVIAIDMPLYGESQIGQKKVVTYDDWVSLGSDYIDHELKKDHRPIFLYGLSAGGMETYHIACKNKKVKGIIGMTFLDQRSQAVRNETTNNAFWAHLGTPLAGLSAKMGLGKMKMKMSICSKMSTLCNDEGCLEELLKDKTSAGNSVPMKFIHSYMTYEPEIEPEDFTICPIILTQPEKDRWTPMHLSTPFLKKIKNVPVTMTVLPGGGHYPIEASALKELKQSILKFLQVNSKTSK